MKESQIWIELFLIVNTVTFTCNSMKSSSKYLIINIIMLIIQIFQIWFYFIDLSLQTPHLQVKENQLEVAWYKTIVHTRLIN